MFSCLNSLRHFKTARALRLYSMSTDLAAASVGVEDTESETLAAVPELLLKRSVPADAASSAVPKRAKGQHDGSDNEDEGTADGRVKLPKKRFAVLLGYVGSGYLGMQYQPGRDGGPEPPTIERDILAAFAASGAVSEVNKMNLQKIHFQRTARTDKAVSACMQVVSCQLISHNDLVERINNHLPPQIRVWDVVKTTRHFNCKNSASGRQYEYVVPTFAFAPPDQSNPTYRMPPETLALIRQYLKQYEGTHTFHNFTSGKKKTDASAKRYIMSFGCDDPILLEELEAIVLRVKGQSFMIHQIRKMIGLVMAMVRGQCTFPDAIQRAYAMDRMDIPRAPGVGLILDQVYFDVYNNRFGATHDRVDWSKNEAVKKRVHDFKFSAIWPEILRRERTEQSIATWLQILPVHTYGEALPKDQWLEKCREILGKEAVVEEEGSAGEED